MKKISPAYEYFLELVWSITLIGLPLTSFPGFARLTKSIVTPFSSFPAFILLIMWFIPYILRRGKLPVEGKPIFIFIFIAIATSARAFFIHVPDIKNLAVTGQELRALFSLGIGIAFFFIFAAWPKSSKQLSKALQWIHIGGAILVVWTIFQAYYILRHASNFPEWMYLIQDRLVVRSPNFASGVKRVVGLAYEPSWFAHQMVLFYLPLWIAAAYEKKSVFNCRILGLSLENILLVIGLCEFYMCSPRVSLISFLLIIVMLSTKLNKNIYSRLIQVIAKGNVKSPKTALVVQIATGIMIGVVTAGIYTVMFAGIIYLGSQRDWRLALLTRYIPPWEEIKNVIILDEGTLISYGNRLAFLGRMATWIAGWRIFNLYPWLGVGLGNAGFFIQDQMPSLGWATVEIRALLNDPNVLPSVKSLWLRVMTETGLAGLSTILVWIYLLWKSTRLSYHSIQPDQRIIALAGELFLVAFISEGFSVDYYAMPYLWAFAGLISSNGLIYRTQTKYAHISDECAPITE